MRHALSFVAVASRWLAAISNNLKLVAAWNGDMYRALKGGASRSFWALQWLTFFYSVALWLFAYSLVPFLVGDTGFSVKVTVLILTWVLLAGISVAQAPMGLLMDRIGIRWAALLGLGLLVTGYSGMGLISSHLGATPLCRTFVVLGVILVMVGGSIVSPILIAGTGRFTAPKARVAGFSLLVIMIQLAALVNFALIERFLKAEGGNSRLFIFMVGGCVLAALAVPLLKEKKAAIKVTTESLSLWAMLSQLRKSRSLWRVLGVILAISPAKMALKLPTVLLPVFLLQIFGEGAKIGEVMKWNPYMLIAGLVLFTPFIRRVNLYRILQIGTLVTVAAVLLLAIPPAWMKLLGFSEVKGVYTFLIITQVILFAVGEFLWSPAIKNYVASAAPRGQEGAFVGVTRFPLWLAEFGAAAFFAGMLARWCPDGVGEQLETLAYTDSPAFMFLLLGLTFSITPVALCLFKRWLYVPITLAEAEDN